MAINTTRSAIDVDTAPSAQLSPISQLGRRKVLSTGSSLLVAQVSTAISGILIARALGPAGKGIIAATLVWPQLTAWMLLLGLNTASSVRVSESRGTLDYLLGNAILYSLSVGLIGTAVGELFLPEALNHLGPGAASAARVTVLAIPLVMLTEVLGAINLGLGRTRTYNAARMMSGLAILLASGVLIALGAATPVTITASGCLIGFVSLGIVANGLPWRRMGLAVRNLRSDLAYGIRVFLTSVLALVNVRLDVLLMSALLGAREIGFYSIGISAMLPIAIVSMTATTLIMPSIAKARGVRAGESRDDIALIRRTALRYTLIMLVVAVFLAILLPFALPYVFGREFNPAVTLAWILLPGYVAQGYATIIDSGLVGMRKPWVGNLSQGAGVVVTASLLPILLPAYQATGAAIVSSLAYTVTAGLSVWASTRIYRSGLDGAGEPGAIVTHSADRPDRETPPPSAIV